ncbi:MAG: alkyl sulfatase dimerization domain-containing protein [bacterium]|nr:alkyl sulfatase dimerization domain-containing protein [bacterium]
MTRMPAAPSIYMGGEVRLTTLANGALTNADGYARLQKTSYLTPEVDRPAPGVTVFGGDGFLNLSLIEGPEGLVVFDTGECLEDGERFRRQIRSISDKPIVAVIYSHSHYVHGTTALVDDTAKVAIIGHPRLNANLGSGGTGNLYAETAPLQISRTIQQFNYYAPEQGPDAPAGANISFGRSGFVPVNTPVEDGQRIRIAGIEMQCFTRYGSDTDDCLTVYLPESGVVLNNILWPFVPNIYTLRGAKFRDPREWRDALAVIRGLSPEALVNTHARAVKGREQVREALDHVIDGLNAILDQTLRGILRGLGPDELRDFVRLPLHLAEFPNLAEVYGEISHFGPYLFNHALGWFDGDAATINPLPPREQASRLVDAMGGAARVLEMARAAFAVGELAWAAQLVNYVFRLNPHDRDVRGLKADILQKLGHITPAQTIRSWYLSQAAALRGDIRIPSLQFANVRILALADPAESIDQYRVRIDPQKSEQLDIVLVIAITDRPARHALHLRRGVVEFVRNPDDCRRAPEIEVLTSFENWLRFFSCKQSLPNFLAGATFPRGDIGAAEIFFAAFDAFDLAANPIIDGR